MTDPPRKPALTGRVLRGLACMAGRPPGDLVNAPHVRTALAQASNADVTRALEWLERILAYRKKDGTA